MSENGNSVSARSVRPGLWEKLRRFFTSRMVRDAVVGSARALEVNSQVLGANTRLLRENTRLLNENTRLLNENTRSNNKNTRDLKRCVQEINSVAQRIDRVLGQFPLVRRQVEELGKNIDGIAFSSKNVAIDNQHLLIERSKEVSGEIERFKESISDLVLSANSEITGTYIRLNREIQKLPKLGWAEKLIYVDSCNYIPCGRVACCVINDTRHEVGHLGCELVMKNIEQAIKDSGGDLVFSFESVHGITAQLIREVLEKVEIVFLNGEGTLHSNRSLHLFRIADIARSYGKKVVLINSVWQNNSVVKSFLPRFDEVFVRDSASHREIVADGFEDAILIGDMTFYSYDEADRQEQQDAAAGLWQNVLIVDSVVPDVSRSLQEVCKGLDLPLHGMGLRARDPQFDGMVIIDDFEQIRGASLVVSGRFHAIALAIQFGVPFIGLESNTHKISGLLDDVGLDRELHMIDMETVSYENLVLISERFDPESLEEYRRITAAYSERTSSDLKEFFHETIGRDLLMKSE